MYRSSIKVFKVSLCLSVLCAIAILIAAAAGVQAETIVETPILLLMALAKTVIYATFFMVSAALIIGGLIACLIAWHELAAEYKNLKFARAAHKQRMINRVKM